MTTTVHIVDDDAAFSDSLTVLLNTKGYPTMRYPDGASFLQACTPGFADPVLLDVMMPETSGLEVLEEVKKRSPNAHIIMMTGHGDIAMAVDAMKQGAADFIEKPFTVEDLQERLEASEAVRSGATEAAGVDFDALTKREMEVLLELTDGNSNKEIARNLDLSPRTVEVHRRNILQKTKAKSSSHLLRLAVSAGFVK